MAQSLQPASDLELAGPDVMVTVENCNSCPIGQAVEPVLLTFACLLPSQVGEPTGSLSRGDQVTTHLKFQLLTN